MTKPNKKNMTPSGRDAWEYFRSQQKKLPAGHPQVVSDGAYRVFAHMTEVHHAHSVFLSRTTLAKATKISLRTIDRRINELLAKRWIRKGDQGLSKHLSSGGKPPKVYQLPTNAAQHGKWLELSAAHPDFQRDAFPKKRNEQGQFTPESEPVDNSKSEEGSTRHIGTGVRATLAL